MNEAKAIQDYKNFVQTGELKNGIFSVSSSNIDLDISNISKSDLVYVNKMFSLLMCGWKATINKSGTLIFKSIMENKIHCRGDEVFKLIPSKLSNAFCLEAFHDDE